MRQRVILAWLASVVAALEFAGEAAPLRRRFADDDGPSYVVNSIGMKFVWIPPGTFVMGSPKGETKFDTDWETQHKVTLTRGFYMGVHLVTQEQWQAVMGNNPSHFKGEAGLPVEKVSWQQCQEFCKKLQQKEKKPYRLPTDAEWEYACRAGTKTPYWFGDTVSTDQANFDGKGPRAKGNGVNRQKTTPVGTFPANPWGLHDMHGNLFQWCQDIHGGFSDAEVTDPQGPTRPTAGRVFRGGAWMFDSDGCRAAGRGAGIDNMGFEFVGLRVCYCVE